MRLTSACAGHGATVHAATIEDGALIGMGATVLDGSTVRYICLTASRLELLDAHGCSVCGPVQVQKGAIVAAGALLTPGKTVPSGQIWAGAVLFCCEPSLQALQSLETRLCRRACQVPEGHGGGGGRLCAAVSQQLCRAGLCPRSRELQDHRGDPGALLLAVSRQSASCGN